jgi:hypothetical protein
MIYQIEIACEQIEKTIEELKNAANKAHEAGDRAAERNLGEIQAADIKKTLDGLKNRIAYITQPRFAKYFEQLKEV